MKRLKISYGVILALLITFILGLIVNNIQEVEAATYTDNCNVKNIHDITGELVEDGIIYQSSFVPSDSYTGHRFNYTTIANDDWTVYKWKIQFESSHYG